MVTKKEIIESRIEALYAELEELKRNYQKENSRYLETKYLNILNVLIDEIKGVPESIKSGYSDHVRHLRNIGKDIEKLKAINEERSMFHINLKDNTSMEENDYLNKKKELDKLENTLHSYEDKIHRKKINNLKIRKDLIRGLKVNLIRVGLILGGVAILKTSVTKAINDNSNNKNNQEYINEIIYDEDNFNNPASLKYFEEQGINKNNVVKDKVCYHLILEEDSNSAKEIAKLYKDKIKNVGIKNVDLMSIKQVEEKIDLWNYQKSAIKNIMEVSDLNYEEAILNYLRTPSTEEEVDIDKEHIFIYLKDSKNLNVSETGTLFDEIVKKSLENNELNVGVTETSLIKNLSNVEEALEYIDEVKSYDDLGEKSFKYIDIPGVDASFIDIGIKDDLNSVEKEKIASSLLESTVMYNLKGSKVKQDQLPKIITDYDKVKFEIENKRR